MKMTEQEAITEVREALKSLEGKTRGDGPTIRKLFNAHNIIFPRSNENGTHCSACVARVLKKCKDYIENLDKTI